MIDAWLEERIAPKQRLGKPVLVLCRTTATANSVRAWAARRMGVAGLEIATPSALAHQLDGPWLDAAPVGTDALPDTPFAARIGARPGLVALARQRVRELRLHRHADPDVRAPAWLEELAATDWHTDTALETRLLDLSRANGPHLTDSLQWSRVVAIGFEGPLDPWTRAVHQALTRGEKLRDLPRKSPRTALGVPDTTAEARLAASFAARGDALVLVQHDATAARVHRALLRNGVSSAWRSPARLERHTLASVIRRAIPWFDGNPDPAIRAVDLNFVLRHPMIDRRLPPPALAWLREKLEALGEDPERTDLTPRAVAKIIRRARHLDAPLSRWLHELDALSARTDLEGGRTAPRALRLAARLRVLEACVKGATFGDTFGVQGPEEDADWGDFDALVANLLGDQDPTALPDTPPGGTLGALRRFLLACRVRTGDDPASLRILGALRRGSDRPATRVSALELLRGAVDKGEVRPGVEILTYEDYDGRPCGQLVLCDVHDQGVAVRPNPDPLLSEAALEGLGILHGRARVDFRLAQLERAVAQADAVVTLVTERDAMGRAVVPPIQLGLAVGDGGCEPYGLGLADLPEERCLEALEARHVSDGAPPPEGPMQRAALQATLEWSRAGRGPVDPPRSPTRAPGSRTLVHRLVERHTPRDWLLPWLGRATEVPEARLDAGPHSVSRVLGPLTHCLYQTFGRRVLRIEEPETVAEELDAKEIGIAVHDTLERAVHRGAWRTEGDLDAARQRFHDALLANTSGSFEARRRDFGALSPARDAAARGLEERWTVHWGRYAMARSQPARDGRTAPASAEELVYNHHLLDVASDRLTDSGRLAGLESSWWNLRKWIKSAAQSAANGTNPATSSEDVLCTMGGSTFSTAWAPVLRDFVAHPAFDSVVGLWREAWALSTAIEAPVIGAVAELPFGPSDRAAAFGSESDNEPAAIGPIEIRLRGIDLPVLGVIDRVTLVGDPAHPLARIADYKTTRNAPDHRGGRRDLLELKEPQLVVYALALQEAIARGVLPEAFRNARVATIGWDHLRAVDEERKLKPALEDYLVDRETLKMLSFALGNLVERAQGGDWLLSPREDTCPAMSGWQHDYCPLAGACRIRDVEVGS